MDIVPFLLAVHFGGCTFKCGDFEEKNENGGNYLSVNFIAMEVWKWRKNHTETSEHHFISYF